MDHALGPDRTHFYSPACLSDFIDGNDECEGAFWCTYCEREYEMCIRTGGILTGDQLEKSMWLREKIRQKG